MNLDLQRALALGAGRNRRFAFAALWFAGSMVGFLLGPVTAALLVLVACVELARGITYSHPVYFRRADHPARLLLDDPERISHVTISTTGARIFHGARSVALAAPQHQVADLHATLRYRCSNAVFADEAEPPALPAARIARTGD